MSYTYKDDVKMGSKFGVVDVGGGHSVIMKARLSPAAMRRRGGC